MTIRLMSDRELSRFEVLRDLDRGRLTAPAAAQLLRLERRQVFRLLRAYRAEGAAGLISKRRGRAITRPQPEALRTTPLAMLRERYWDFGPAPAAEKLGELHGIALGRETLRQWMIADGLWLDRKQRLKRVHQPRSRRDCVGELVQIDGCEHWWFEDRGPQCTLLVFVDDATGRLMQLQFVESESTFSYFHATRAYLEAWGKPVAFYSDKHGVFRVNHEGATGGDGMTQFGRALNALHIEIICANSSQAKGRVERRTRPCRTDWSKSCGLLARVTWRREMPCFQPSRPITTSASPNPRRMARICTVHCAPAMIWRMPLPGRKSARYHGR